MKKNYFFSLVILITATIILGLSCSKSGDSYTTPPPATNPPAGGAGSSITINGMTFSPASLSVGIGTVVKWTNNDYDAHTVTSNDGSSFDSGNIRAGGTFSYTAAVAGTFKYHCTIHGITMAGTLTVTP